MPFEVAAITENDFAEMRKFVLSKDGTLAAPLADVALPADNDELGKIRSDWSIDQQLDFFRHDPTTHFVKAVDTETKEIVSLARWHKYSAQGTGKNDFEWAGTKDKTEPASYPPGFVIPLVEGFAAPLLEARPKWQVQGPHWALATLKTREPCRRRGAGGLLVTWGVQRAIEDHCPAYLEAMEDAKSLYEKHGFIQMGHHTVDLNHLGIPYTNNVALMAANQSSGKHV